MKTRNLLFAMLIVALVGFSACDAEDILPIPKMEAVVDGVEWKANFNAGVRYSSNEITTIAGTPSVTADGDKTINLTVYGLTTGNYSQVTTILGSQECLIAYMRTAGAEEGSNDYFISTQAEISITKIDIENKKLAGTFSGHLWNAATGEDFRIDNGTFSNIPYSDKE